MDILYGMTKFQSFETDITASWGIVGQNTLLRNIEKYLYK